MQTEATKPTTHKEAIAEAIGLNMATSSAAQLLGQSLEAISRAANVILASLN